MQQSPIFSRTYDLLLWLLPQATKFPHAHRFGLGERVTNRALDLQETLLAAGLQNKSGRGRLLILADIQLAQLKQYIRLCKDLQLLSIAQYEHVADMLVEIGRLLGGWIKTMFNKWGRLMEARGVRGGSWNNNRNNARCAYRNRNVPDNYNNNCGFRLVLSHIFLSGQ